MVRLEIDGSGYDSATETLISANHIAAINYNTLIGKLGGYGAMAGDDSTSEEFAREYDSAAKEAVGSFNAMVDTFATLGELTATSIENHVVANAESVYGGTPPVYDGSSSLPQGPVDVKEFTPPSCEGGDNEDLPQFWNEIVDHLQGFAWPNADVDKLREAAGTWRTAASDVEKFKTNCTTAVSELGTQKSPEIPIAVETINEFKTNIGDLATELRSMGDACDDYATQVEQTRQVIKDIVRDMAIEAGVSLVVGGIVGFFSFGGGAAAGAAVAGWRIASAARKILKALQALKAAAKLKAVAKLGTAVTKVKKVRGVFDKIRKARKARKHAQNVKKYGLNNVNNKISRQKQSRHVKDTPEWKRHGSKGYFNDHADAQKVLDAVKNGDAQIIGKTKHGDLIVRYDKVTGYNNNPPNYVDQATNVFVLKGTKSPSLFPANPSIKPVK